MMTTVSETLRRVLIESGERQSAIAAALDIPDSVLSRFRAGGGLRSENCDKLCAHFGLELRPIKRSAAKRPAKKGGR